ncbi:MAG: hypothetical protein P4L59_06345 [Desulfosporosinus sp.]|nr:hypothetical protein [Desulfosporosinus sp.]
MKRNQQLWVVAIALTSMVTLGGCSAARKLTSLTTETNLAKTAYSEKISVNNKGELSNKNPQPNPLFNTTLTLPNGQTVTPDHEVQWKDLIVSLQIQSLPSPSPEQYLEILGNHSTALTHSNVSTSAGTATLVLNKRTPPATAKSTTSTYEYWVIVYGSQCTYAIEATVIGNRDSTKNEVMELLGNWKVP